MLRSAARLARALTSKPREQPTFRVALVGRPNVGKSTLFNRLCGRREAIVSAQEGTTRDRREGVAAIGDLSFELVDTGGLEDGRGALRKDMLAQTQRALADVDAVLFMVDARAGVTEWDRHFAGWLRRQGTPQGAAVHVVANKAEASFHGWEQAVADAERLGFGEALPLSAEHGEGVTDLHPVLAPLEGARPELVAQADDPAVPRFAIVGRPNVGKSSLLNALLREERVITGPTPGLTRDSISASWEHRGRRVTLVDTAGVRKRGRRGDDALENLSALGSLRSIRDANVVGVVVDVAQGRLTRVDLMLVREAVAEGKGIVVIANKVDLMEDADLVHEHVRADVRRYVSQVFDVPVVVVSAQTGEGLHRIVPAIFGTHERWASRVNTGLLNRWLQSVLRHHPPPNMHGKPINIKYITQAGVRPPTFALFSSRPKAIPGAYLRFLRNSLHEEFGYRGVPVRLSVRGTSSSS